MTKAEANQILDRVKNGIPTSNIQITEALLTTGDIGVNEANRGARVAGSLPRTNLSAWEEPCESLVG